MLREVVKMKSYSSTLYKSMLRLPTITRWNSFESVFMSTLPAESPLHNPAKMKILPEQEIQQFRSFFPIIVEDLTSTNLLTDEREFNERFKKVLEYNVPYGKYIRPAILIAAYKFIEKAEKLNEERIAQAIILSWCIELMQSSFLIVDDIVDNGETRRGQPAWFKKEGIGLNALNDATVLEMSLFKIINKYFSGHKHYRNFCNLFVDVITKTYVGQIMDYEAASLKNFSEKNLNVIAAHKTGYYTFYCPIGLAMYLADREDLDLLRGPAFDVFMDLGRFFQFQNDYLDCYGGSYSGKLGTDIQEGKWTWLLMRALEKASPSQKIILEECYGKWDMDCVTNVKHIYDELNLKNSYVTEMNQYYDKINSHILKIDSEVSRNLLRSLTRVCLGLQSYLTKPCENSAS